MNVLLLASHSVAEYDDIRMLTDLGYDVFCPGGYQNPAEPGESLRPGLPDAPYHPDLVEACERVRGEMGDPGPYIDWAKAHLADEVIEWADVIICHHFPERWICDQWERIGQKRVIWRTCGQSDPRLERQMLAFHDEGLQIVRYSPREKVAFEPYWFAGEDAVIRFGKYPSDYGPWDGSVAAIGNVTQDMAKRGEACGLDRWERITAELTVMPAGPGSEVMRGGIGALAYPEMLAYLRHIRGYLYLGTQPASYTLGLIEAMMSGVPVVPVPWDVPSVDWMWLGDLWEANDLVPGMSEFLTVEATHYLQALLRDQEFAAIHGEGCRRWAVERFGIETVGAQWKAFLG